MSISINDVVDDMQVIEYLGQNENFVKHYKVKCLVCGNEKVIQLARLHAHATTKHSNKYCGIYIKEHDKYLGLTIEDHTLTEYLGSFDGEYRYLAKCNICGTTFETYINNFLRKYGTNHKKACSKHLPKDRYINRFKKIYSCMRYRTCNPKYTEYRYYGGRGINSDYFEDFMVFYHDMFESYKDHVDKYGEKNTSLDRIDPDGNYTKANCRWATNSEQRKNTRKAKMSNDYSERK
jgi:ribosomal protein S27E